MLGRAPGTGAAWTGLPLDDAWIHLVYARSLASGAGFSYNPGQAEAGFTSPLWVLLLTPIFWLHHLLGLPLVTAVKVLGILTATFASVQAFRVTRDLTDSTRVAWLAGVLVCVDPSLGFARVSGMEVWLTAGLALAAIRALAEARPLRLGVLLALLPLARPEALSLAVPALVLGAWVLARQRSATRAWLSLGLPITIALGTWALYCLHVSGRPLPNTFYAKHHGGFWQQWADVVVLGRMLLDLPWFWMGSGVLAVAAGMLSLGRSLRSHTPAKQAARVLLLAGPLLWLAGITWAHDLLQPWPFFWNRYVQPALPCVLVVAALGAATLSERAVRAWREGGPRSPLALLAALLALPGPVSAWPRRMKESVERYAWNCQNINEVQVAIGQWVASHAEPNEWVAGNDAGALRFFGQRPVLDLLGLNNHDVLARGLPFVMARHQPGLFAIFPDWFPGAMKAPGLRVVHEARSPHYTICDFRQDRMVVLRRSAPTSRQAATHGRDSE